MEQGEWAYERTNSEEKKVGILHVYKVLVQRGNPVVFYTNEVFRFEEREGVFVTSAEHKGVARCAGAIFEDDTFLCKPGHDNFL